jgi:hypothetical protein
MSKYSVQVDKVENEQLVSRVRADLRIFDDRDPGYSIAAHKKWVRQVVSYH